MSEITTLQNHEDTLEGIASIPSIRLNRIVIQDFKAIDKIDIKIPIPEMDFQQDIIVFGSKNGLGKTSLLESCALLFLSLFIGVNGYDFNQSNIALNMSDLTIRAGRDKSFISGLFKYEDKQYAIYVNFDKDRIHISGDLEITDKLKYYINPEMIDNYLSSILGIESEPFILPPFYFFHSFRKVTEGNPELGMLVERKKTNRRKSKTTIIHKNQSEIYPSSFKTEILRSVMSKAGLFENENDYQSERIYDTLNSLIETYAGGRISKLRPSSDNTIELRIEPISGGESFPIDGLSSGQKSVISTLFMIWRYTMDQPGIVLIDEPELHMNPEWHRKFIRSLYELAPRNQYIVATHSEDIFASVKEDRRIILRPSAEEENA